jgi:hypothetical protein
LPENFPSGPQTPDTETPTEPEPAKKLRISRNGVLIILLAMVVIGGLVLIGTAPSDDDTTGASATQTASPATTPAGSSAVPSSAAPSPSASSSASPSASASASHPVAKGGGNAPADRNRADCGPHPSSCGFPDASNTGVPSGVKLAVVNGNMTVKKAGTVIDGKDIRGCVLIDAPRVTIRRSKVTCTDFYVILSDTENYSGGGLTIQDSTISCQRTGGTGIGSYGLTAIRVDVSGCENGFDIDNTVTVRDSYIHDPYSTEENHADGAQLNPGGNITFRHNTIFMPESTSAIISNPDGNSNVLVEDNLMSGGAYTLYCPRDRSTNYRVINNRFSTVAGAKGGAYGPWTDCNKAAQVTGNVWDATLKPLSGY